MLLTTCIKMEEETWSRRGWSGGGGGVHFKILLLSRGVQFSYVIILGG